MNELEQWIHGWLTCPIENLDVDYDKEDTQFPEFLNHKDLACDLMDDFVRYSAADDLLLQLHEKTRGHLAEPRIWNSVLAVISHPLPDLISNYLIDREMCIFGLGHMEQNEAILKRLVPLIAEALLTFAKRLYTDPNRSLDEFAELIAQYPNHEWLFYSLAHAVPSSPEKQKFFLNKVREHPRSEYLLNLERDMREVRAQSEWEKLERQRILEMARHTAEESEIRELLNSRDQEILLCLICNPNTPEEVLLSMTQFRNFTGARELRGRAKNVLDNRKNHKLKHPM